MLVQMEILESVSDLIVQSPPETEFSAADLKWIKLGTAEHCDDAALIPYNRVDEFIIGECSNVEFPTRFHIERGRKRTKGSLKEYKDDEYLEYRMYWCSFGPENHGEGGAILPSRRYRLNTRNRAALPQSMRGCTCHFTVKRLYARPSLALLIYNERRHVNKSGFVCHGPLDRDAIGPGAKKIPYICNEIQQQTMSMIYLGIPEENVLAKHIEGIQRYCGSSDPKVDSLASQYVHKLGMIIKRSTHELDLDDEASIKMWVERNRKSIFFYQDSSGTDPFILGIQTEWQLQQLIRFGHRGLVAADTSFGIKRLKYPLYTLLVFDSRQHALPVAWVITRSSAKADVSKWMKALVNRVHAVDSGWKPSGFLIDDATAELDPIRDIFCSQILFSIWRIRRTWLRNVLKKCSQIEVQREIFKGLGKLVYSIWREVDYSSELEDLLRDFADQTTFTQYFKDTWMPKIEMWLSTMRSLPLASQEASGAIEAYHVKLKSKLYDDTHLGAVHRVDWLVHKLTTELHSSYWLDRYADESDSFQSVREEYIASTSWHRALTIPDSSISFEGENDQRFAKVQKDPNTAHLVWNPGSEFAFCDCTWALQGNLCKHVIKVNMVCENCESSSKATSLSFNSFREIVTTLLKMPMDDSMELDKAVAYTYQMLDQIKGLVELNSAGDIGGVVNKLPLKWVSKKSRSSSRRLRVSTEYPPLALTGPSSLSVVREGNASRRKSQKRKRR